MNEIVTVEHVARRFGKTSVLPFNRPNRSRCVCSVHSLKQAAS